MVLGVIVIEFRRCDDLPNAAYVLILIPQNRAFKLTTVNGFFHNYFSIIFCGIKQGFFQFFSVFGLGNPHRGAGVGRFDETGISQFFLCLIHNFLLCFRQKPPVTPEKFCHGDFCRLGNELCIDLIHGNGGRKDATAHIRDLRQFQQPLYSAVLSPCAMKGRNHHIHRDFLMLAAHQFQQGFSGGIGTQDGIHAVWLPTSLSNGIHRAMTDAPVPFLCNAHRQNIVFLLIQRGNHIGCRHAGNLMFRGLSAKKHNHG